MIPQLHHVPVQNAFLEEEIGIFEAELPTPIKFSLLGLNEMCRSAQKNHVSPTCHLCPSVDGGGGVQFT